MGGIEMERRMYHPRPQFIRADWELLDGAWHFKFDDEEIGILKKWYEGLNDYLEIKVPFTYETSLSGINDHEHHNVVWYERQIELLKEENYVLNFEGVDYFCQVWLNGQLIGTHKGGYERFSFDIGAYTKLGMNTLTIRVEDSISCEQPRGKQRWLKDNFGCWYVQTTGIWKSVWLEEVSTVRFKQVKMTPNIDEDTILLEPAIEGALFEGKNKFMFEAIIHFAGELVCEYKGSLYHNMQPISLDTRLFEDDNWGTKQWSPQTPNLYDITFKLYDENANKLDEVDSYFGMRKIMIDNGQILLNNRVLYQRLILDQGYWRESGITPPSVEALEEDINQIIKMGYNGLRKHQKIEDERFLYLCDKKGMLVWSEMPSTYSYNDEALENFTKEWLTIVKQYYNHPSIITWVPFNESWGIKNIDYDRKQQNFVDGIYHLTKAIDSDRPVITNDGWVHTISDILTLHDYEELGSVLLERYKEKKEIVENKRQFNKERFAFANNYHYKNQPIIISEFGGIAFSNKTGWGYGNQVETKSDFIDRFENIHEAIQSLPYVSGYCYTQLTDVEQEVNGLLTTERNPKINLDEVKRINMKKTEVS